MDFTSNTYFLIGIIFFIGLASHILAQKTFIPRVTFLILIGIVLGPNLLSFFPEQFVDKWFDPITTIALGMIGFLLGQQFTFKSIKNIGKQVLYITLGKVIVTFVLIAVILTLFGVSLHIALILASIATATAPAAVYEVVKELKINTPFSKKLLAIVAIDDIIALLLFSIVLSFITINNTQSSTVILFHGVFEILGSLIIGALIGYPVAKITGRLNGGEPIMVEALGAVFIVCGLAQMLELSTILAAIALGSSVSIFATHHSKSFHAIKNIEWPFMILFFLLAGASLNFISLLSVGIIGIAYIVLRAIGCYLGTYLGARFSHCDLFTRHYMGFALIPQAGVAIGMALMASHKVDDPNNIILSIILGATIFFEIVGPIVTRSILKKLH